jgi:hypothetical protein
MEIRKAHDRPQTGQRPCSGTGHCRAAIHEQKMERPKQKQRTNKNQEFIGSLLSKT